MANPRKPMDREALTPRVPDLDPYGRGKRVPSNERPPDEPHDPQCAVPDYPADARRWPR